MKIKYFVITAILSIELLSFGGVVKAIDNSALIAQIQVQIQLLLQQIQQLQSQQDQGTAWCHTFNTNLQIGNSGSEVAALHEALRENGLYGNLSAFGTSDFDSDTVSHVKQFQAKYGIAQVGVVGPITRAKLNALYGCKASYNLPPVISGVTAPTTLSVGQIGTWTVRASDPENGTLSYSFNWGDVPQTAYNVATPYTYPQFDQTVTNTHSYSSTGAYTVTVTVRDNAGQTSLSSATVQVGNYSQSSINITSPNGGESWQRGTTQTISWRDNMPVPQCPAGATCVTGFPTKFYDIKLVPYHPPCTGQVCPTDPYIAPYTIATGVNGYQYTWNVGNIIAISNNYVNDGPYTIQVCQAGTNICDSSDSFFTVTLNNTQPSITVTSPNGGESWVANSVQTIRWVGTNQNVDLYLDHEPPACVYSNPACLVAMQAPYILDYNVFSTSSFYNWIVATDINNATIATGKYRVRVCLAGSQSNCDTSDNYFSIVAQ